MILGPNASMASKVNRAQREIPENNCCFFAVFSEGRPSETSSFAAKVCHGFPCPRGSGTVGTET